jgi:hypothetical protein
LLKVHPSSAGRLLDTAIAEGSTKKTKVRRAPATSAQGSSRLTSRVVKAAPQCACIISVSILHFLGQGRHPALVRLARARKPGCSLKRSVFFCSSVRAALVLAGIPQ